MAGTGTYIDPKIVIDDYRSIEKNSPMVRKIVDYANRFIAHHDKRQQKLLDAKNLPKYVDLLKCIDKIEEIYVKYYTLITGDGITLFDQRQRNHIEGEIKSLFKIKWI